MTTGKCPSPSPAYAPTYLGIGTLLFILLTLGGVYLGYWFNGTTDQLWAAPGEYIDPDVAYCSDLLSLKMGRRIPWNTTLHPARIWLKWCLMAQRYDPDYTSLSREATLFYDGTADRLFATYLDPQNPAPPKRFGA